MWEYPHQRTIFFCINLLVQAIEAYIFNPIAQDLKYTIEVVSVQLVPISYLIF